MTLKILTSEHLSPIRHGFFTRKGGVSGGIYSGLNCGPGSNDDAASVAHNRALVAQEMGVAPDCLISLHQVHSAKVQVITGPQQAPKPRKDAMVTNQPGYALGVLTADCQPVLFADHRAQVIGAAHAGWKGTLDGVLEETLCAMENLGARRENTNAVIGPCISQDAYEVGPEFQDGFLATDNSLKQFFISGRDDRLLFDLPGFGLHCLRKAGVGTAYWTGHCTYRNKEDFFSYRRTTHNKEPDYGRLIAAIAL